MKKALYALVVIAVIATMGAKKQNEEFSEYSPTISADGNTMIYQSDILEKNSYKIFMRQKTMDGWTKPTLLDRVCSREDDGGPFITYDQNHLIISSTRKGGIGDVDLWISTRHGQTWSEPVNMGAPVNSAGYDGFASLSPDGNSLYFVRECPEKTKSKGDKFGIFFSTREDEDSPWSEPKKMPEPINSAYSEFGPVILADNITLIFSSTRPGGFGSYDLYKVEKQQDGSWTKPVNLGDFINTAFEDKLITIPASGDKLYYAKALSGEKDIYRIQSIPIPEKLQQSKVLTFSGAVMDEKNNDKKLFAEISITDVDKDTRPIKIMSNKDDGKFMVILNKGRVYDVAVKSKGYTFYSTQIDLKNLEYYKEMQQDILLEPLEIGAKIILNNMFFEKMSYKILPESKYELRRIVAMMKENPTMKLEISGHTDSRGTRNYNNTLSEDRALAVVEYLTDMGVPRNRFKARGFGPDKPIADNDTEEGRRKNRRVEINIIEN